MRHEVLGFNGSSISMIQRAMLARGNIVLDACDWEFQRLNADVVVHM